MPLRAGAPVETVPFDGQRQSVERLRAVRGYVDQRHRKTRIAFGQRQDRVERRVEPFALAGEPAACREECRQHFALEHLALSALQERAPAVAEHQRDELGNDRGRFRGAGILAQQKPEESVWRKRDHEGSIRDPGKPRAAQHFHWHETAPRGQIDLGRLRRARQVGDAQRDLVLVLAQVGEHGAIRRAQE